jgi:hypothetical protein
MNLSPDSRDNKVVLGMIVEQFWYTYLFLLIYNRDRYGKVPKKSAI